MGQWVKDLKLKDEGGPGFRSQNFCNRLSGKCLSFLYSKMGTDRIFRDLRECTEVNSKETRCQTR